MTGGEADEGLVEEARDERLEEANAAFYAAFEALDLDRMDAVWDHGDEAYCVHPGGELIVGWAPVRRSWAAIFSGTEYMQFIVTDVLSRERGAMGVVTCTENILAGEGRGLGGGRSLATNVFVRGAGGTWRMVGHHASPVLRRLDR